MDWARRLHIMHGMDWNGLAETAGWKWGWGWMAAWGVCLDYTTMGLGALVSSEMFLSFFFLLDFCDFATLRTWWVGLVCATVWCFLRAGGEAKNTSALVFFSFSSSFNAVKDLTRS